MPVTRIWSEYGFWRYSCGCSQFQDGYELCPHHKLYGYAELLNDYSYSSIERNEKQMNRTITRRFYPGANISNDASILGTLVEAIDKAKAKLLKNPELEEVNIVEIVKVVRRKPIDIEVIVEDVR